MTITRLTRASHWCQDRRTILVLLNDCWRSLDNYSDVIDGPSGRPAPNQALRLRTELEMLMLKVEEAQ